MSSSNTNHFVFWQITAVMLLLVSLVGCAAPDPTASPLEAIVHLSPAATPMPEVSAQTVYEEGLIQLREGDLAGALDLFDQVLVLDPGFAPAYRQRGVLYQAMGEPALALADLQMAIILDPEDASAYALLGEILRLGFGDLALAWDAYEKAIDVDPAMAEQTFAMRWRVAEALKWTESLRDLAAEYAEAHPDDPLAAGYRGRFLLAQEVPRAAIQTLVRALEESGGEPAALWFVLGQAYEVEGAWAEAKACYEQAQALVEDGDSTLNLFSENPVADLSMGLGMAYLYTGDCGRAQVMLEYALLGAPDRTELNTAIGRAMICQMPTPTPEPLPYP